MHLTIAERHVHEYEDDELIDYFNRNIAGNKLQQRSAALWVAILRAFDLVGPPMTVRQMFYALVSAGAISKAESGYRRVGYHLLRMRREHIIPYHYIADNTRWVRKPDSWFSLDTCLSEIQETYRRALWDEQYVDVELWLEKDALAGVLCRVTEKWDVPLMVTRGFPSESYVYSAAEKMKRRDKLCFVYYLGDHDPSGRSITETTERKLKDFGADCIFEHIAVLPWQIEAWNLPTRPTKRSDSRAKGWKGGSVELDAIPADKLRQMAEEVITGHLDQAVLEATLEAEREEREILKTFISETLVTNRTLQEQPAQI